MKKKIFLSIATIVALAFGVVGMSAYEAHVVNVTATIENATDISATSFDYGTTFPEEILHQHPTILLSTSFANSGATSLDYVIKQKPKCIATSSVAAPQFAQVTENSDGTFICPAGFTKMPLLCPFLSKTSPTPGDKGVPAFHGPLTGWNNSISVANEAFGHLGGTYTSTTWDIDLHVPCFQGQCGQDWATYVHAANSGADPNAYLIDSSLKGQLLGCDLWYEVTNVNRAK